MAASGDKDTTTRTELSGEDGACRIASNIAKLPTLLGAS